MPAIYQPSGGIGALLRKIELERKTSPATLSPGAGAGSPIRRAMATPLESPIAPESPGTSRVISVQPGTTPSTPGKVGTTAMAPRGMTMGQIGGGGVVAPTTAAPIQSFAQPTQTPAPAGAVSTPMAGNAPPQPAPQGQVLGTQTAKKVSPVSQIATSIRPLMQYLAGGPNPWPSTENQLAYTPEQTQKTENVNNAMNWSSSGGFEKAVQQKQQMDQRKQEAERKISQAQQIPAPQPAPAPLAQILQPIVSWLKNLWHF